MSDKKLDLVEFEKTFIRDRREALSIAEKDNQTDLDTVGLAFSGGGIRSATFNLGILQGLANLKLLKYFDYLSTVSGGGYIGSWFTAWIQREGNLKVVEEKLDPEWAEQQAQTVDPQEPAEIKYLRRHSNYLAPKVGIMSADMWVLWASYLRNFLLNQLLLFPTILAILLVTRIILVLYHPETMAWSRYWWILNSVMTGEDTESVKTIFVIYRCVIVVLICILWSLSCYFAFEGSGRVRLAEVKSKETAEQCSSQESSDPSPEQVSDSKPITPNGLVWKIVVPLVFAALLFCFLPASRLPNDLTITASNGFDFYLLCAFIGLPPVFATLSYIAALCRRKRWLDSGWHLLSIVSAALLGGLALYFVNCFLESLSYVGPWDVSDYVKARAAARITTFGPPLVLAVITSIIFLGIAILRDRIGEELREWWSSVCARLLLCIAGWLAITSIAYYATSALIYAGPWILTILGSSWFIAVASGVIAAGSTLTGENRKSHFKLEFLARLAPSLFLVGIIFIISLVFPLIPAGIGDSRPDWSSLMSELDIFKQKVPSMPSTKVSHVTVESTYQKTNQERRFVAEYDEVLSDSEVNSYKYWLGMFHVADDEHKLTGILWNPSVLWTYKTEEKEEPRIDKHLTPPMRDIPPPPIGSIAKAKAPLLPSSPSRKKFSSRQVAQVFIEHTRGMIDPAKISEIYRQKECSIEDVRELFNHLQKQKSASPVNEIPRDDPNGELIFADNLIDNCSKDSFDSLTKSLDHSAVKWKPSVYYKLFPADMDYLRDLSPELHLPNGLEKMKDEYTKECFEKLLKQDETEIKKLFHETISIDTYETTRLIERLALNPRLISFSPGLLLLKYVFLLVACGMILLVASWCVDVNLFSLNALDGNRLTRAYLGASRNAASDVRKPDPITNFDPADDMPLSNLAMGTENARKEKYLGPYYLINAALNLVRSDDLSWQERQAASFVFTPNYCGSKLTGYRPTNEYAQGVSLGEAVSISGAAASPNSGYHSSPAVSALLTMFNTRMGAWLGNPIDEETWRKRGPSLGYWHLLKELLGWTDSKSPYVYLSDGGHFENLAVYELVRRRCRYIVVCDAGADPDYTFEDLGNLIRKVRIDFGIRIEIDHSSLTKTTAKQHSSWHCAVGQIRYDDVYDGDIPGMLIYIKPSLSGDEPGDILQYAQANSAFPQEPTSDQFFSESQFESYRALGQHIAESVFAEAVDDKNRASKIPRTEGAHEKHQRLCRALFSSLSRRWFAMPSEYEAHFATTTSDYTDLQKAFAKDDRLKKLSEDLYPELRTASAPVASTFAAETANATPPKTDPVEFHTVLQLVQTMEKAWLTLNLDANFAHPINRGWLDVFFRWTRSDAFRRNWPFIRSEFSERFVMFCEKQMRMGEVKILTQPLVTKIPTDLADEFRHQWPDQNLDKMLSSIDNGHAWLLVPQLDDDPPTLACGFAMVLEPIEGADDAYELFLWIRGAYRNSGNGRKAIEIIVSELRLKKPDKFVLQVKLQINEINGPGGKLLKRMWLTFFHNHGFRRPKRNGNMSENTIILERMFPSIKNDNTDNTPKS